TGAESGGAAGHHLAACRGAVRGGSAHSPVRAAEHQRPGQGTRQCQHQPRVEHVSPQGDHGMIQADRRGEESMLRLLAQRALHLVIVVLAVYPPLFFLLRLTGDPALLYVSEDAGPAQIERVRAQLGLSDPLPVQYARFLGRALVGDFGLSLRYNRPALPLVLASLPATLE